MVGGSVGGGTRPLLQIYLHLAQRKGPLSFSEEIKVKSGQMAGVNKSLPSARGERVPVVLADANPLLARQQTFVKVVLVKRKFTFVPLFPDY